MAGSHQQRGVQILTIVLSFWALTLCVGVHAQTPPLPDPVTPGDLVGTLSAPDGNAMAEPAQPVTASAPSYYAGEGTEPTAPRPRVEMGVLDTIADSLFGDVYAEGRWRPLSFGNFFSQGWLEPWAGGPAGQDGLTPRHGWLGAFDGVFYRLWLTTFTYTNSLNTPYGGNHYGGDYQIFLPLSRRFEILLDVPFVVSNGTLAAGHGYTSEFGDLIVTPRFLLSENEATTQCLAVDVRTPTGSYATGNGIMSMHPRYEFWTNPGGAWVVRGGSGIFVPMNKAQVPAQTAYTGDLAIGRYFTPHEVLVGDLVFYAACNWRVPLDGASNRTYLGVGPGTRFHIANNYFFLHYWEFPLTGPHPDAYTMQVALLKVF